MPVLTRSTLRLSLCMFLLTPVQAYAQAPAPGIPEAAPEDVASVDAVLAALYDVISGPAGEARDWDRFKSLLLPSARLIPTFTNQQGQAQALVWTPDDYIQRAGPQLQQNGFFEKEVARTAERFGNVVHAFSTYESYRSLDDEAPFMRGINSIQIIYMGDRWWIANITWQSEQPNLPIPEKYLQ